MRRRYTPAAVSAPSVFSIPLLARSFAVLALGFMLAGCAAPGARLVQRPPKDLPPSLSYVTADVLGFTLARTSSDDRSTDALIEQLGMTTRDAAPWIGDHAGVAVRQLDVPGTGPDTSALFADVRSRAKLEAALTDAGWTRSDDALPEVNGDASELWMHDSRAAMAVFDDGLLRAPNRAGLVGFLNAADSYAVPERTAMRQYAVEVVHKVSAGIVFRTDLLRTGVRRPFQHSPALLELARWATESDVLVAARDGWIGFTPGSDDTTGGRSGSARLVGAFEWVPKLAADIDWGTPDRRMLDTMAPSFDVVVALDDPGQHLHELVKGITFRNGQYVTDQDVQADEDRVELEPLFEDLDGESVVAWDQRARLLELRVRGASTVASRVDQAIEQAGLDAQVTTAGSDLAVTVGNASTRSTKVSAGAAARVADATRAGRPPRPPIGWLWTRSITGCTGPAAGWVTFDGTGEMTFSIAVAACPDLLQLAH